MWETWSSCIGRRPRRPARRPLQGRRARGALGGQWRRGWLHDVPRLDQRPLAPARRRDSHVARRVGGCARRGIPDSSAIVIAAALPRIALATVRVAGRPFLDTAQSLPRCGESRWRPCAARNSRFFDIAQWPPRCGTWGWLLCATRDRFFWLCTIAAEEPRNAFTALGARNCCRYCTKKSPPQCSATHSWPCAAQNCRRYCTTRSLPRCRVTPFRVGAARNCNTVMLRGVLAVVFGADPSVKWRGELTTMVGRQTFDVGAAVSDAVAAYARSRRSSCAKRIADSLFAHSCRADTTTALCAAAGLFIFAIPLCYLSRVHLTEKSSFYLAHTYVNAPAHFLCGFYRNCLTQAECITRITLLRRAVFRPSLRSSPKIVDQEKTMELQMLALHKRIRGKDREL